MSPNPLLRRLGLSDTDRAVIIHADDIGMCHASLAAYEGLVAHGLITSAAAMVPCPWFPATADFCRRHPGQDMGVHLTLTSEWDAYRWGPVSTRDPASGLLDDAGLFHRDCQPVQAHAAVDAVHAELTAQVNRALAAGIDVTHLDAHMACLFHPRLLPAYLDVAQAARLPALLLRPDSPAAQAVEFTDSAAFRPVHASLRALEADGFPLLDAVEMMSLDQPQHRLDEARRRLARLPAGVSYFIIHPCQETPALRAMAPDWRCRVADYEMCRQPAWREAVAAAGVHLIDWRTLRNLWRQE